MNDYGTLIDTHTFQLKRVLPGPIERVWAYLTQSDKRGQWLATGEMDLREGGAVELHFSHADLTPHDEAPPPKYKKLEGGGTLQGHITKCEPPRLLGYRWGAEADASEVTFELKPQGADVLLVLTHSKLRDRDEMISVSGGWHVHMDILIDNLEGREPRPFWSTHAALEAEYEQRLAD